MKNFLLYIFLLLSNQIIGQNHTDFPDIKTKIFADIYYGFDASKPPNHERPDFLFNYKRHNEVSLNLGLIRVSTETTHYRANLGLMAGNYAQYNLSHEPTLLRHVFEANVGIRLYNNLWIDVGIMPSYIGFENAISSENPTLTRSLAAENSPYYISGASISWKPDTSLTFALYVMNGWQRIQRIDGNQHPHFGSQIEFSPNDKIKLNWSTFIGSDYPDYYNRLRVFNNLFVIWQPSGRLSLTGGFDIGYERINSQYFRWFTPVLIGRYQISNKLATAIRGEYFHDRSNIIIVNPSPIRMIGASINLDYNISENILARIEGRQFINQDPVFSYNGNKRMTYFMTTASLAVNLNR